MFINFTNHHSKNWSAEQIAEAEKFGEIFDMPFPNIDPEADEHIIKDLAVEYSEKIVELKPEAVLCQGEMTFAFAVVSLLTARGITVLAACSKRVSTEAVEADGSTVRQSEFRFERFRKYLL